LTLGELFDAIGVAQAQGRRLYDVLNPLEAVGLVEKISKKKYRWKPSDGGEDAKALLEEREDLERRILQAGEKLSSIKSSAQIHKKIVQDSMAEDEALVFEYDPTVEVARYKRGLAFRKGQVKVKAFQIHRVCEEEEDIQQEDQEEEWLPTEIPRNSSVVSLMSLTDRDLAMLDAEQQDCCC